MKINILLIFASVTLLISACSKSATSPTSKNSTLTINSLSINHGAFGTFVYITGTGFDTVTTNNHIYFNNKAAQYIYGSTTKILVLVPLDAGTGNVSMNVNGKIITGPLFTYELSGVVTTLAGGRNSSVNGSQDSILNLNDPWGITIDANNNIYVADKNGGRIKKITPTGVISIIAGTGAAGSANGIGTSASFNNPLGLTIDNSGNIYVADSYNFLIRKITPALSVTNFAGASVTNTNSSTSIGEPTDLAIDNSGNIFVADNATVKKVSPSGQVTMFANDTLLNSGTPIGPTQTLNLVTGVATDNKGNVYVAYDNFIRKITSNGSISTVFTIVPLYPQSYPTSSIFVDYTRLVVDKAGNIFFTDPINFLVREITTSGSVVNIAGNGAQGPGFTNGTGTQVNFGGIEGIAIDNQGILYVTETSYNDVRKIVLE